jgi:uncharacterized membrane protein
MTDVHPEGGFSTARVETLGDGIFAIVMTLLVLQLRIPAGTLARNFPHELRMLWPQLGAYVVSFVVLGIYWVAHHNQFAFIKAVDRGLLWINILFYLVVALVPFSASVTGSYHEEPLATAVYGGNLIAVGLVLFLHWRYATSKPALSEPVDARLRGEIDRHILIAPALYTLAIGLGFVNTLISLAIYALVPVLYIMPNRVDRTLDEMKAGLN